MKKLIYILLVGSIAFTSCTKKILDKEPLDYISDNNVFRDETLMDAYLAQAYIEMTILDNDTPGNIVNNWDSSTDWSGPFIVNEIADESMSNWLPTQGSAKYGGIQIHGGILEWWEYSYRVIRTLNYFIEKIDNSPESISDNFKKTRAAEARFLRAFNYFSMVKRYGGVPIITRVQYLSDSDEELFRKRNKEQEVYDFIISEMDAIADDLYDAKIGRPTKYAAMSLKSRAALYAASIADFGDVQLDGVVGISASANEYYKKSYEASIAVMNGPFSLYNQDANKTQNFKNVFLKKGNSEAIWVKQHNDQVFIAGQTPGNGWSWDFFQTPKPHAWNAGNQNAPYLELVEAFEYVDGSSGVLDRDAVQATLWDMDDLWANKDPRFYATIWTNKTSWQNSFVDFYLGLIKPDGSYIDAGSYEGVLAKGNQSVDGRIGTGFGVMKYLDESHSNLGERGSSKTDWILFRYGEVLLNYAEAAFELGKPGEALDAINQIRDRAGIAPLTSIDRAKIRHERRVELAFEGHRYWDLRRWRIATDVLTRNHSGIQYILDYTTRKYRVLIQGQIDGNTSNPVFDEKHYYLPITIGRTGNNPNLVENPGYY